MTESEKLAYLRSWKPTEGSRLMVSFGYQNQELSVVCASVAVCCGHSETIQFEADDDLSTAWAKLDAAAVEAKADSDTKHAAQNRVLRVLRSVRDAIDSKLANRAPVEDVAPPETSC